MSTIKFLFIAVLCSLAQSSHGLGEASSTIEHTVRLQRRSLDLLRTMKTMLGYVRNTLRGVEDVISGNIPHPFKCTECFEDLGCFDACNGTFHYIHLLPETPDRINTTFRLYPWYDNETMITLKYMNVSGLNKTIFEDTNRGLLIVNHGFAADANSNWMHVLKDIVIEHRQHNVILVDWLNGAAPFDFFYPTAVVNTDVVGRQIAVLLQQLMSTYALKPSAIHYIGHSLGAQCGHFFAEYFKKISGGMKINRITALDAASPLFEAYDVGLNPSDAVFVDALHTSAGDSILTGKLGVEHPVGHVDFYLNGGTHQPGCWRLDIVCAHRRAHEYYVEAVENQFKNSSCDFSSHSCVNGIDGYKDGTCISAIGNFSRIGYDVMTHTGNGMQYLETSASAPFCKS